MDDQKVKEHPILFSGPMVRAILEGRKTQTRRVVKPQPRKRGSIWEWVTRKAAWHWPGGVHTCPYGKPGDRLWVRETWATEFNQRFHDEHGLSAPDFLVDADTHEPLVVYAADREFPMLINDEFMAEHDHVAWKSPIHMRRAASRITLEITGVRVERLQEITEADAIAEGLWSQMGDGGGAGPGYKWKGMGYHGAGRDKNGGATFHFPASDGRCACNVGGDSAAQCAYHEAWDSINAKRGYSWESSPWVWVISFTKTENGQHG